MKVASFILSLLASGGVAEETLCQNYQSYSSNNYEVINNLWGISSASSGSQCTYVDSVSSTGAKWHSTWEWQGGQNNVKSYVYSALQFTKKPITQYTSMKTEAYWVYNTTNIRCDVAYDLFTSANVNHATTSGDYELMVWLARYSVDPIGTSQGTVTVAGQTWELFAGLNGAMEVYSFVASNTIYNFDASMLDFFTYLPDNMGFPGSSQNLITFEFGTEAFTGGPALFTVNQWDAYVY